MRERPDAAFRVMFLGLIVLSEKPLMEIHHFQAFKQLHTGGVWPHKKNLHPPVAFVGFKNRNFLEKGVTTEQFFQQSFQLMFSLSLHAAFLLSPPVCFLLSRGLKV